MRKLNLKKFIIKDIFVKKKTNARDILNLIL